MSDDVSDSVRMILINQREMLRVSQILDLGAGLCVHYAAVAKSILDQLGLDSEIVGSKPNQSASHAYLVVKADGVTYIFDPFAEIVV